MENLDTSEDPRRKNILELIQRAQKSNSEILIQEAIEMAVFAGSQQILNGTSTQALMLLRKRLEEIRAGKYI